MQYDMIMTPSSRFFYENKNNKIKCISVLRKNRSMNSICIKKIKVHRFFNAIKCLYFFSYTNEF